ncbi:MAG: ShlB/FhaC/HecB family hemolysin secretion/activation protein [Erythrobacter sp.]
MRISRAGLVGACICIAAPAAQAQDRSDDPHIAAAPVITGNSGAIASAQTIQTLQSLPAAPQESADQIGAIVVIGNEAIEDAQYQAAVEEFFGEPRNEEVLARLTNQIAALAREAGFPFVRADIIDDANRFGVVQVMVDEGRVDEVRIEGYQNAQARRILNRFEGNVPNQRELDRALLLVTDIPAVLLRGARLKREDGRGILFVELDQRDASLRLNADNYGTEAFGPVRAVASVRVNDALSSSDQVYAAVRINPIDLDELLYFSGSYETQLSVDGVTFGVDASIGTTAPGGAFGDTDISGESLSGGATLSAPVIRTRDASLWVDGRVSYISIEQDDLGAMLRDDTVVTAAIGLRTQWAVAGGRVRAGVSHVRGLGILGATRRGDALASRFDGDGVFSKIEFWSDARFPLASRLDIYLSTGGQIADRPLLASEEIALGGAYRTRGYDFSEVLGDEGVHGLIELRYRFATTNLPLDFLQIYAFVDGGYVSDIGAGVGEGSLFSAGPGVRARIGPFDLELETGIPLGGSAETGDDNSPEVNLRAGVNF